MNIQQRNSNFLSLTAQLLKPSHVKAVATEIGVNMTRERIKDRFSDHVFTVEEVEPGLFQSVFPERLSQSSSLHDTEADAWEWIEEVREQDANDNAQFGVGA